jgi:hypothetical protein
MTGRQRLEGALFPDWAGVDPPVDRRRLGRPTTLGRTRPTRPAAHRARPDRHLGETS